jgi:MYXO-CTERM domain-containing protein
MYLGAYNCIYDDGTVISLEQGPCEDVRSTGAYLVDSSFSGTEIDVTTPAPGLSTTTLLAAAAGLVLLAAGRRRRK